MALPQGVSDLNPSSDVVLAGTASKESNFFVKDGIFYAIPFKGSDPHPRKSASELYEHLTYVPPPPAQVDEHGKRIWRLPQEKANPTQYPADFYSSQLVHYGVKTLKTKKRAQNRLLSLFSGPDGKTLEVPKSILEFEETLRKRSQAEIKPLVVKAIPDVQMQCNKLEETSGESQLSVSPAKSTVTTPNQIVQKCTDKDAPSTVKLEPYTDAPKSIHTIEASSSDTIVSKKQTAGKTIWNYTDALSSSDPGVGKQRTAGKTILPGADKVPPPAPTPKKRQTAGKAIWPGVISEGTVPLALPTAADADTSLMSPALSGKKRSHTSSASSSSIYLEPREAVKRFKESLEPPPMTYAEIQDAIQDLSADRARELLEILVDEIAAVTGVLEREILSDIDRDRASKLEEESVSPTVWTGIYHVEAPLVKQEQHRDYRYEFEIYPSSTAKHLWVSFDFGTFQGVMRSLDGVPKFLNKTIRFQWRGDMIGRGMIFDDSSRAEITFLPGGLFEGKMCAPVYGTYRIYGYRSAQSLEPTTHKQRLKKVSLWKSTWRSTNSHNYDIENIMLFKSSTAYGLEFKEDPYASDTTCGEEEHTTTINSLDKFMNDPESSDQESSEDHNTEDSEEDRSLNNYISDS